MTNKKNLDTIDEIRERLRQKPKDYLEELLFCSKEDITEHTTKLLEELKESNKVIRMRSNRW